MMRVMRGQLAGQRALHGQSCASQAVRRSSSVAPRTLRRAALGRSSPCDRGSTVVCSEGDRSPVSRGEQDASPEGEEEFYGSLVDYFAAWQISQSVVTVGAVLLASLLLKPAGIDVLQLWHGPAAGWGAAWPTWTACFMLAAAGGAVAEDVRAGLKPRLSLTNTITLVVTRIAEGILYRGVVLGFLTRLLAPSSGNSTSVLTSLIFLTPFLSLALGIVEGAAVFLSGTGADYGIAAELDAYAERKNGGKYLRVGLPEVPPALMSRVRRTAAIATTLPPLLGGDSSSKDTTARHLLPAIAAAAAGSFLSAETLVLSSLQASMATAVLGSAAFTVLAPRNALQDFRVTVPSKFTLDDAFDICKPFFEYHEPPSPPPK